MKRRTFLARAGALVATSMRVDHRELRAQSSGQSSPTGVLNMDGDWYRPVRLPPKPNATQQVSARDVDELERKLACPCPCTHDVLTCRTADAVCVYAPAIHRDLLVLAQGGYASDEMLAAMRATYGDAILMLPSLRGASVLAWLAPIAAITVAGYVLAQAVRAWQRHARMGDDDSVHDTGHVSDAATPDEMARVIRDVRNLNS